MTAICVNPACDMPRGVYRRCRACYAYYWRHGTERPARTLGRASCACVMHTCARPGFLRGLCKGHYRRWLRQRDRRLPQPCANPACPRLADRRAAGRCRACYVYHWRHGVERPARWAQPEPRACNQADCGRPVQARGLCNTHYIALWRAERRTERSA